MAETRAKGPTKARTKQPAAVKEKPRCGLCGKRKKLTKTECCDRWICDDEDNYVLFSYGHTSCSRNHRRYTLCAYHFNEQHRGNWQDCKKCRRDIEAEMYVYYATNEHNFDKLADPPAFEPTRCAGCNKVIKLATDGYCVNAGGTYCMTCHPLP